jgi:hypothetical protein
VEVDEAVREVRPTAETSVPRVQRMMSLRRNLGFTSLRNALYGHSIPETDDRDVSGLASRWTDAELHLESSLACLDGPEPEPLVGPLDETRQRLLRAERGKTESCIARYGSARLLIEAASPDDTGKARLTAATAALAINRYEDAHDTLLKAGSAYEGASNAVRLAQAYTAFGGPRHKVSYWLAMAGAFANGRYGSQGSPDKQAARRTVFRQAPVLRSSEAAQRHMIGWRTV